jgi:hypothetical protein
MEINFGFEVTSIAGISVNSNPNENRAEDAKRVDSPEETKDTNV